MPALKLMECNRDEAIRAKTIAEKKLVDKDFAGAKKFSLKAQTLYPELDGISQMLVTLDVFISSENKVNGESDWYGILDVKPSDDDETIRKQYRKLVLLLHPDKNKSVGADGAFKILSEAWSLLSDKSKRSAYNQRRNVRGFQQKVPFQSHRSSSSPSVNVVHRSATRPTPNPKTTPARVPVRPKPQAPPPARVPVVRKSDTFWTVCNHCKTHYEYFKVHLNCTILCPSCHKPFRAVEVPVPKNFPKPPAQGTAERGPANIHCSPALRAKVNFNVGPSGVSMGENIGEKVNERRKRECEDFNAQRFSKRRNNEDGWL